MILRAFFRCFALSNIVRLIPGTIQQPGCFQERSNGYGQLGSVISRDREGVLCDQVAMSIGSIDRTSVMVLGLMGEGI